MSVRRLVHRVAALLRSRTLDRELNDEIRAHLELAEREGVAAGLSPEEARRRARRSFGSIEPMKENHRDQRSVRWFENLVKDLRYGLAALVREPGFAAVTIGVLAIGIGGNTAVFSVVDAALLKPLPFPEPERIVRVWEAPTATARNPVNTLDFLDWKQLSTSFTALSAEREVRVALTGRRAMSEPVRISGKLVSADYFDVFAVQPVMGRGFAPDEDQPGSDPIVILSHAAWSSHFGQDAGIIGSDVILDGTPHRVVGVLPRGVFDRDPASFWKPLVFTPEELTRGFHWLRVVGRLRDGVSLAQAREEMTAVDQTIADLSPPWKHDWGVIVEPFAEGLIEGDLRRSIVVAFGAMALVLLIACANVANLLLAKGAVRKKEMAVRTAIGASRGRLVVQLLTENVVLCLAGATAGVALAFAVMRTARPFLSSLPATTELTLDVRVLGYTAALAVAVCLLTALLPSIQTSFGSLSQTLNASSRGSSESRDSLKRAIVIGEFAVSLVLVCGSFLMFKSLSNLQNVETGVQIDNVITMSADLPLGAYPTPQSAASFFRTIVEKTEAVAGVTEVALSTDLPFQGVDGGEGLFVPGTEEGINVRFKRVDPNYFSVLGIPMLAGRGFRESDREGAARVMVVNVELARRLSDKLGLGVRELVGQNVRVSTPFYVRKGGESVEGTLVGVIRSERVGELGGAHQPVLYVSLAQVPTRSIRLLVRSGATPSALIPAIQAAVHEVDPNLPLGDVRTMAQVKQLQLAGASQPTWVVGAFAAIAALLAALGMFGVLSHAVTQKRREIGIRVAFGASRSDILAHVLRSGVSMIAVGLALGLAATLPAMAALESVLFEVSTLDPIVIVLACASMVVVGVFAGFVPASRAASVDPMTVLRNED